MPRLTVLIDSSGGPALSVVEVGGIVARLAGDLRRRTLEVPTTIPLETEAGRCVGRAIYLPEPADPATLKGEE